VNELWLEESKRASIACLTYLIESTAFPTPGTVLHASSSLPLVDIKYSSIWLGLLKKELN